MLNEKREEMRKRIPVEVEAERIKTQKEIEEKIRKEEERKEKEKKEKEELLRKLEFQKQEAFRLKEEQRRKEVEVCFQIFHFIFFKKLLRYLNIHLTRKFIHKQLYQRKSFAKVKKRENSCC